MNEPVLPRYLLQPVAERRMGVGSQSVNQAERFREIVAPKLLGLTDGAGAARPGARIRRELRQLSAGMACTDMLAFVLAFALSSFVHERVARTPVDVWVLVAAIPVFVVIVFSAFRLYSTHRMAAAEEFRRVLLAGSLIVTSGVTFSFWTQASFSRLWIASSWLFSLALVLGARYFWRWYVKRLRSAGRLSLRTLILGANAEAGRLATVMGQRDQGFEPVGYVCGDAWGRPTTDLPMLGHIDDLTQLIWETQADCVFIASSAIPPEHVAQVSKTARREGIEVRVTANVQEVLSSRVDPYPLAGLMAFSLRPVRLTGIQAIAKRAFDLGVTAIGTALLLPVFAVVALTVKLSSPGPVLFRQERVGYRGRPFTVLKFRTMVVDAEELLDQLQGLNEATGPLFKMRDDPRVTRAGKWLRRWSLDELPQLFNVLRGDMSLVGPRPPLPREVAQYEDWQIARLEVRPGITGLWQVSGRSELPFEDYVRLDMFYIENWSLAYDLFILAKTIPSLATTRGAR